jgi:hypothetical protein
MHQNICSLVQEGMIVVLYWFVIYSYCGAELYEVRSESRCALTKTHYLIERTIVIKNELNNYSLYRYCTSTTLTTEYSETTAHFNVYFHTDNQIYVL